MRNIELKARCPDLAGAEAACRRLGARRAWTRRQTDVYFAASRGRLKLRIEEPGGATLVAYHREDRPAARESRYELTPVDQPQAALAELAARHGLAGRVEKTRTLYQLATVRIHLDAVRGLGTFVELEAAMGEGDAEDAVRQRVGRLAEELGVEPGHLVGVSYRDLLARARRPEGRRGEA
ncbi:MAG: class IV adenylate cyclase [bacterium]